ncbi:MAG: hypothetical protein UW18_C0011G0007 [Microgenomates group bacterium GW2011_GWF1_44_10]|nr:MAG: hypothetical protein UW18_C0011G0007 [Microgenomates group bacterium GW2011_GWF1_44_10]
MLNCGRRFGKDIIQRNYASEGLLSGEPVAWYEPEYKSLMENWNWFVDTFYPITKDKSEVEKRIDLVTGGYIEMWSLQDKDASRGRHYKRALVNEAAKVKDLEYSWNAVIRITLADLQGSAMIGSTPKGLNYFKTMYDRGMDNLQNEWASFHKTTYDNPYIARSEIEELKNTLPEIIFNQEILAEFINSEGAVFRRVQEAVKMEDPLDEPQPNRQYIAGVDVAASIDYTVVSVMDVMSKQLVYMDRFNRVDYSVLEDRLYSLYHRWNLDVIKIEANSIGQPVIDHLENKGMNIIPFMTTSATKQPLIMNLQSAFEHGDIGIYNYPVLIGELLSFESKRSPSGSFSYSAPDGLHDDTVMSLALAWDCIGGNDWSIATSGRY